jgi:hypothetical protein
MANREQAKVDVLQGTLYPGAPRQRGLVRVTWGIRDNNRKARFYAIAARRRFATEKGEWDRMTAIMRTLLHGEG